MLFFKATKTMTDIVRRDTFLPVILKNIAQTLLLMAAVNLRSLQ